MVAGDVVNGLAAVISTALTFQPAASVEVMVSTVGSYNVIFDVTNGVNAGMLSFSAGTETGNSVNMKLFINNTNYLSVRASGGQFTNFSGIQIK